MEYNKKTAAFSEAGAGFGLVAGALLGAAIAGQKYRGYGMAIGGTAGLLGGGYGIGALSTPIKSEQPPQHDQTIEEMLAAERKARQSRRPVEEGRTLGDKLREVPSIAKVLYNDFQDNVVQPAVDYAYLEGPGLIRRTGKKINQAGRSAYRSFKKWHAEQQADRKKTIGI